MAIIDVYNKKRGVTYVYDSHSYWDKELKQPRSRRKLLGRRDPATGEIVPTGSRGRRKSTTQAMADGEDNAADIRASLGKCSARLKEQDAELAALRLELRRMKRLLSRISALAGRAGDNA